MCIAITPASAQTAPNIISWGENQAPWNQNLGVLALREGCSIYPTSCEPYLDNLAAEANVKTYYVSMPFSVTNSVAWAKEYSNLSLTHKMMLAIGFDDFVNKIENYQLDGTLPDPATWTSQVIAATKSKNPNLGFGVTIYEDSLNHAALLNLPATLRAQIEYVHLYVHYRQNGPNYASYVATAKTIFPKAKIIAGAYPYDRMDYLPCAFKGTVNCTWTQEQDLYKQTLQIQLNLVKAGTIYGLEFFFGYFGDPQDWPTWTDQARICQPARLATCWANSKTLQSISLDVLRGTVTPAVSLQHTSLFMGSENVGIQSTPGTVAVTNSGGGPLSITGIGVSGINKTEFPMTHNCPTSLAAGASCTLTVSFKPAGTGTREADVVIFDNAGSGSQSVALSGTGLSTGGTPSVSLQYTSLFMGQESVGVQSTPGKLIMTNSGSGALSISSISTSNTEFPMSHNCGTSLPAKTGCTLTIYFKPSASGTRTGSVVIKDNAGSGTQTVALTGTGLSSGGTPVVSLAHTSLFMGQDPVGTQGTPAKLIMTNSGTGALAISSISSSSAEFPMTHNCGTSLPAKTGCTITISFKPSASGTRSGSIVIKDNAGSGTQTVALTGTGQSSGTPVVTLANTSLFMGQDPVGTQGTPAKLIMTNSGTATLSISSITSNSTQFPMTHNCGTSLPAKTGCTITISFKPSGTGTRTGSIIIKDNAGSGTQTVTLTGTGQ